VNVFRALISWMNFSDDEESTTRVTYSQAIGLPPVWYAVNKISGDIGQLPIDVKKVVGDGAENDLLHDGYRLLREQPNKLQSPSVFKEQITGHALIYGNGRAAIIRNGDGIEELIPMLPDRTWTVLYKGEKYHVTQPLMNDNKEFFQEWETDQHGYLVFRDDDVLHIPAFTYDGVEGIGLLQIAQDTFGVGNQSNKHVRNQLRKGFRGKLFLEAPAVAFRQKGEAEKFIEDFNKSEAGSDNAGKAALLREGMKVTTANTSNQEGQLVDLQKFNRQDVGLLFGIDRMPGDGESISYNSLEQQNLAYLMALDRWLVKWEEQCDIKLRSPSEKRLSRRYFKFNRGALLRTDLATTMEAFSKGIASTILNPNECRSKLDLNPYKGGDVYENPAITVKEQNQQSGSQQDNSSTQARALDVTVRSLMQREANNAISGSKNKNFLAWIESNYAKWEPKLADKLEELGIDRDEATKHCEQSKAELLAVAGDSTEETLEANVRQVVAGWINRKFEV
jgi:HK97 family phage portal protein